MKSENRYYLQLKEKISNKSVVVGVIGLGYDGLPFIVEKAKVGLKAIGFDKNEERLDKCKKFKKKGFACKKCPKF